MVYRSHAGADYHPLLVCCLVLGMQDFVDCCDKILPFFDHLGPVFHVARSEVCAAALVAAH